MPRPHACGRMTSRKMCFPSPCQLSCALPGSCSSGSPSRTRRSLPGAFRRGRGGACHSAPAALYYHQGRCRCRQARGQTPAPEGDAAQRCAPCSGRSTPCGGASVGGATSSHRRRARFWRPSRGAHKDRSSRQVSNGQLACPLLCLPLLASARRRRVATSAREHTSLQRTKTYAKRPCSSPRSSSSP